MRKYASNGAYLTGMDADIANWLAYLKVVGYVDFREYCEIPVAIVNTVFFHHLLNNLADINEQISSTSDTKSKAKLMTIRSKIETKINEYGKE